MNFDYRLEQWSDRINPIIVRELRQTVRSGLLLTALMSVAAVVMLALLIQLGSVNSAFSVNRPVGRNIFLLLVHLLCFFCLLIIPLNAAARLLSERDLHNIDLLYATLLSPQQIICGKLVSGGIQTGLFFAICAPFLFVTNLLRGIDLLSIMLILLMGFLAVMCALQIAIFVGCLNVRRVVRGIIGVIAGLFIIPILMGLFAGLTSLVATRGIGGFFSAMSSENGVAAVIIGTSVMGVLHAVSISCVGKVHTNYVTGPVVAADSKGPEPKQEGN